MSNSLAIVAVTAALRNLLQREITTDSELADTQITTLPLDRARGNNDFNQLNLFLYQTGINAAWRNMPIPSQAGGGESGFPPLPLDLNYLITAYGQTNNEIFSHRLLGRAMSILHDHPILGPDEIRDAQLGSDLHDQKERVRITLQPISLEEMSKLWTAFQSQYRISAVYRVSVVLIESTRAVESALPVLRRGREDQGAAVLAASTPWLKEAVPPEPQASIRLGEDLSIRGEHLDSTGIRVRISSRPPHPLQVELDPMPGGTDREIKVHLSSPDEDSNVMARWAPGFYTVAILVSLPDLPSWLTNEVSFALAPQIEVSPTSVAPGDTLTVICRPRLRDGQKATLIFGRQQIAPTSTNTPEDDRSRPTTLEFIVPEVEADSYVVRLRVDGIDSIPVVWAGSPPRLEFDPGQRVTVA